MTVTTPKHFSFMNLPPEVRDLIYLDFFSHSDSSVLVDEDSYTTDHAITTANRGYSLLQACRTIYGEARCHVVYRRLVFRTEVHNNRSLTRLMILKLGQQLTGSIFLDVETIVVGVTDLWRIIASIDSLKTRMTRLKTVETVVVDRAPYRSWKQKLPTVLQMLETETSDDQRWQDCLDPSISPPIGQKWWSQENREYHHHDRISSSNSRHHVSQQWIRFRFYARLSPALNEDHYYADKADENAYDQGDFRIEWSARYLAICGLEFRVYKRLILVDDKTPGAVQLELVCIRQVLLWDEFWP